MKTAKKVISLTLGAILAVSLLAGCGANDAPKTGARICYDNLGLNYVNTADTQYTLKGVESMKAVDGSGNEVEVSKVASYSNDTFTAVSEGTVVCTMKDKTKFRLEVAPAYVTNPGNQYTGTTLDLETNNSPVLGTCHDPSLIEVEEEGAPAYYIFSTGWNSGNEIRRSTDMVTWKYMGKSMNSNTQIPEIEEWLGKKNNGGISWWAPDIVAAPTGGYWLYTCCVSDRTINSQNYSMACIVLFYSETLEAGSFQYSGVLMQSCIPKSGEGSIDVNSIDPQIIYDEKGNMFMAYGSFGTGNWMLELNPKTGLRKDGKYSNGVYYSWEEIRTFRDEVVNGTKNSLSYLAFVEGKEVQHDFYGKMISYGAEEAPVIARHDNVTVSDETATYNEKGEPEKVKGETYYYSMHSFNGLDEGYQMWGGRSSSVWGEYLSVNGTRTKNYGAGNRNNGGNKYTGGFTWLDKSAGNTSIDIILPGHNDLFTNSVGTNIAAYITRTRSYGDVTFVVQLHQYYLNSLGDICINANRYGKEIDRNVSANELFACTDNGKFKMVVLANDNAVKESVAVVLTRESDTAQNGTVTREGSKIGTWQMYGKGYVKFSFDAPLSGSNEKIYYGVVRPAWLDDQNKSGFTITCMGHTPEIGYSTAMYMNNVSTITGNGLVG